MKAARILEAGHRRLGDGGVEAARDRRSQIQEQLGSIESLALWFFVLLAIIAAVYGASASSGHKLPVSAGSLWATGLLLAVLGAGAACGGVLGFLFGIPRLLGRPVLVQGAREGQGPTHAEGSGPKVETAPTPAGRLFQSNTNLEDISDFLTKIIVGLSLVEAEKIFRQLRALAGEFQANALNGASGANIMFSALAVASFAGGFLFFYLETRTRITLLLVDAEIMQEPASRQVDAAAVLGRPLVPDDAGGAAWERPDTAGELGTEEKRFLDLPFEKLRTPEEFAAWGTVQARVGNVQAALRALMEAVARRPEAQDYLERLSTVQLKNRNPEAAIASLRVARRASNSPSTRTSLLRRELFTSLYVRPPVGFNRALEIARRLEDRGEAASDEFVQLWTASAYGQKFAWLVQTSGTEQDKAAARAGALEAVERLTKLQPNREAPSRRVLRQIYDPGRFDGNAEDNDLEIFKGDPAFETLIVGP